MTDLLSTNGLGPQEQERHEHLMRECISLAKKAAANGESAVGSVLVKDQGIIARGIEAVKQRNDFTCHAEIECIRNASAALGSRQLAGYTLYTTHEPCIMCSYVIRQTGISGVVIGMLSGEKGGLVSRFPLLSDTGIQSWAPAPLVITGILEKECRGLK